MSSTTLPPQTDLKPAKYGDTWKGLPSVVLMLNGAPMSLVGAEVLMQVRKTPRHGVVAAEWSSTAGTITFPNASGGELKVHSRVLTLAPANYSWSIQVKFADGRVLTPVQGSLEITANPTRQA